MFEEFFYTADPLIRSMTRKVALFAFNGEPMCFVHVLLNALDMRERGYDVRLVIEGSATKLVKSFTEPDSPARAFAPLYEKVKEAGLIDCACRACSVKMGSLESAEDQGIALCDEMSGHPSIARYMEEGYETITF
jgi:hypothetical protein